ncbi:hypothetical protein V6N12_075803 [Hibiscus sabdariffa]|uniref:RNase H type-1 domain-containing protein n=1 Tax=Hibiscus sabdariffa TaxID=183260 RepID=A0ABR2C8Q1_9ROSI
MERLGHRILHAVSDGSWRPFRLVRAGVPISYLFFVDDLFLYAQASPDQGCLIDHILTEFGHYSGHKVNRQKSQVYFSSNTDEASANAIGAILGMPRVNDLVSNLVPSQPFLLRWCPAPDGWFTLNTDSSVSTISSFGSAGGLIRNNEGNWLIGFNRLLGITTPMQAELWAIHEGLLLVWSLGLERL